MIPSMLAIGQGGLPPNTILDALADLSKRVGTTLDLRTSFNGSTSRWQWAFKKFSNTALDCPQAGEAYRVVETLGYEYVFVYLGKLYDYRVPQGGDASQLRFCENPIPVPSAFPTTPPAASTGTFVATVVNAQGTPISDTQRFLNSDGTPEAVTNALTDLNTRLKTSLTLQDLSVGAYSWRWDEVSYTNDALECPKRGYTPVPGTYAAYRIVFVYRYTRYEYRALINSPQSVFLCSIR
jgi:hypothetical protein